MRIKLNTIYEFVIIFLIVTTEKYFFLTKEVANWLEVLLIFTIIMSFKILFTRNKENFWFGNFILAYIILNIISAISTILIDGQPLSMAIAKYKFTLIILLYLPLKNIIKRVGNIKVEKIFVDIAIFASIITIIQKIIYTKFIFIHHGISLRNNQIRSINIQTLVTVATLILVSYLFNKNMESKFKIIVKLIPLIYYTFFISMTRSAEISLIITLIILLIYNIGINIKTNRVKKLWIVYSFFITIILVFIGYKYIYEVLYQSVKAGESSSINRLAAIDYFFNMFKKRPIIGYGMYNNAFDYGIILIRKNQGFFIDDIGVIGYLFQFGVAGIMLLLYLFKIILDKINKLVKSERIKYLTILIFFIVLLPFNCLLNIDSSMMYIALYLASLENC